MSKFPEHGDMLKQRGVAFSNRDQYEKATRFRKLFAVSGQWWAGQGNAKANKPKPEFHSMWNPINRIIGSANNIELNPVISPNSYDADEDGATLLQGLFRNDSTSRSGVEAKENAVSEAIIGGFGCFKMTNKYENEDDPDPEDQYLCYESVLDASSSVVFGAEAIKRDKSDAKRAWQLVKGNREAFEEQFGVKRIVSFPSGVDAPANCLNDVSKNDCYLAHYYEVVEVNTTEYDFTKLEGIGSKITTGDKIRDEGGAEYKKEQLKELRELYKEKFGELPDEKRRTEKVCMYALCDGEKYLTKPQKTPFKRVPLFPIYAYHYVIDGEEYFNGLLEKSEDCERLKNYVISGIMEVASEKQTRTPIFLASQIGEYAQLWKARNHEDLSYLLMHEHKTEDGSSLLGPVGYVDPSPTPQAALAANDILQQHSDQTSMMGQVSTPANASGEAIQNVNERQDDAFLPVIKAVAHAYRASCEAWIDAAMPIYFSNEKSIRIMTVDGKHRMVKTLQMTFNEESGDYGPYDNNPQGRYSVRVEQGEAYKDRQKAARDNINEMLQYADTNSPTGQMLLMKSMALVDGEGVSDMKHTVSRMLLRASVDMGIEPETENEEDAAFVEDYKKQLEAQQSQAEDPNMVLAKAEEAKAQAQLIEAEIKQRQLELQAYDSETKRIEAETHRLVAQVDAEEKGVKLELEAEKVGLAREKQEHEYERQE